MSHEWAKKAVEQPMYSMRDMEIAEKQAQAEVLAACQKALCWLCADGHEPDKSGIHFLSKPGYLNSRERCAAFALRSIQPAAKDLEELLRGERERGHTEGHQCDDSIIEVDEGGKVKGCFYKIDALRKEKARASEGGG